MAADRSVTYLCGCDIDAVDATARDVLDALASYEVDARLATVALCRAIVAINYNLDAACRIIDEIAHGEDLPALDADALQRYDGSRQSEDSD